ncbi:alpha-glucosidase [Deinobacterium chartae]|uniref:Alpha-glucosidase n=1 Tax=Deinobacterium chartae TaxID=521158 RepID=A0A841HXY0_9DEIO|nr:alpha-amylase family glycosyl hydrolase [Deinobacterium chartae]MBB6097060.1 alpha-glucosidase [Deinobacterium chartae]
MNAIFDTVPCWHDHTPAYTSTLRARRGQSVTVRLKTLLDVQQVQIKVLVYGEIYERPTREIAPVDGQGRWFEADFEVNAERVRYAWQLLLADDTLNFSLAGLTHTRRGYRDWFSLLADYQAPEWVWERVFYQIFPDRFRNGNPDNDVQSGEYLYGGRPVIKVDWDTPPDRRGDIHAHYGGDLEGITQALPYLEDLGVNALWLTPIFESPSNHRYDIRDYRKVDPHLGGDAAFEALMRAAQERDFKVVLDGVFNHTGDEHALFCRALHDHEAPERDLFTWKSQPQKGETPYAAFFDVPTLPKIDYTSPRAFEEFIDGDAAVVRHWLRRGIDGWRLDVAQMIGAGGTDAGNLEVHRRLKRAAREENPEAYVFGERFFDAEHALETGQGEDGVMNYHGFGLPVMEWLAGNNLRGHPVRMTSEELLDLLWDAWHALPAPIALNQFNLLDSHDLPRAMWRVGGDRNKLLAGLTMLMAFPGVPCIFYGTEVGLNQPEPGAMPFCRVPMPWDEGRWDSALLEATRKLIRLRKATPALQRGTLRLLACAPDAVAWLRELTHADGRVERAALIASRSSTPAPITLTLPEGNWVDALAGTEVGAGGEYTLELTGGTILLSR